MQDIVPCYATQKFIDTPQVINRNTLYFWQLYTPSLNHIQHLWNILGDYIQMRCPDEELGRQVSQARLQSSYKGIRNLS